LFSGVPGDAVFGVGLLDFAGGSVVHLVGGASSIVAAKFVGYRNQYAASDDKHKPRFQKGTDGKLIVNDLPSSSPLLATLGTFILWFGWYGFNCGSVIDIVGREDTMSR
jgi:Amt family ammonium transporter